MPRFFANKLFLLYSLFHLGLVVVLWLAYPERMGHTAYSIAAMACVFVELYLLLRLDRSFRGFFSVQPQGNHYVQMLAILAFLAVFMSFIMWCAKVAGIWTSREMEHMMQMNPGRFTPVLQTLLHFDPENTRNYTNGQITWFTNLSVLFKTSLPSFSTGPFTPIIPTNASGDGRFSSIFQQTAGGGGQPVGATGGSGFVRMDYVTPWPECLIFTSLSQLRVFGWIMMDVLAAAGPLSWNKQDHTVYYVQSDNSYVMTWYVDGQFIHAGFVTHQQIIQHQWEPYVKNVMDWDKVPYWPRLKISKVYPAPG